jgi:hypothetical protein
VVTFKKNKTKTNWQPQIASSLIGRHFSTYVANKIDTQSGKEDLAIKYCFRVFDTPLCQAQTFRKYI